MLNSKFVLITGKLPGSIETPTNIISGYNVNDYMVVGYDVDYISGSGVAIWYNNLSHIVQITHYDNTISAYIYSSGTAYLNRNVRILLMKIS